MDIGIISSLILDLGFPIVVIIACGYFIWHLFKVYRDDLNNQIKFIQDTSQEREEKMFKQLDDFNDTLNKFNETLIKIDNRLCNLESKIC